MVGTGSSRAVKPRKISRVALQRPLEIGTEARHLSRQRFFLPLFFVFPLFFFLVATKRGDKFN